MEDPIRLTFAARNGEVQVTLNYLNRENHVDHVFFIDPDAARYSAGRLRMNADRQPHPDWVVYLLARAMDEDDGADWVQVDLIARPAIGPVHRGGMTPDNARAAADALEAAAAEVCQL